MASVFGETPSSAGIPTPSPPPQFRGDITKQDFMICMDQFLNLKGHLQAVM